MRPPVYPERAFECWRSMGESCILDLRMRLSLQVHYAICGIFDLAYNAQGGAVQVRVIGERQGIPGRYLEQIFRRLRQAELVLGKRGPGGGYRLSRSPATITLLQVVEAVEGPLHRESRMELSPGSEAGRYRPDFLWEDLSSRFAHVLSDTSLESRCRKAAVEGVVRFRTDSLEYQI
ncbi:MAG: Rrf2 family transcriptional regulator [Myxococcota bacterium]|nr:Rrf2 family transcriptional regulator [Myxococcota bacterium]